MAVDVFSAILSYATIPLYVAGLLLLVYIIARSQLGLSITGEVKEVVKTEIEEHRPETTTPFSTCLVVAALFGLFIGATIITERRKRHS